MSRLSLFDHNLNTGEANYGADSFPLGDGGTPWANLWKARASGSQLTAANCTIDATGWNFTPPTETYPLKYIAVSDPNTSGTYDPVEIEVDFLWDDVKCHKFNICGFYKHSNASQWGGRIQVSAGVATVHTYRLFTDNSFLAGAGTTVTKPSAGANMRAIVRADIDQNADIVITSNLYNMDVSTTVAIGTIANTYAATETQTNIQQGVSMGDATNESLTSPTIKRVAIFAITTPTFDLVAGGATVYMEQYGRRTIAGSFSNFSGVPTLSVSGVPAGIAVSFTQPSIATGPGGIRLISNNNLAPGTYSLTCTATYSASSETVNASVSLIVVDYTTGRPNNTVPVVLTGTSSVDNASIAFANALPLLLPGRTITITDNNFPTESLIDDWQLIPPAGGSAYLHAAINAALQNRGIVVGGDSWLNDYSTHTIAEILTATDVWWGEIVANSIPMVHICHQRVANTSAKQTSTIVSVTDNGTSVDIALQAGHGASAVSAYDYLMITKADATKHMRKILSKPTADVMRTDPWTVLPTAGQTYQIKDGDKPLFSETLRARLKNRADPNDAAYLSGPNRARIYDLTDTYDWPLACLDAINNDELHASTAGNLVYGQYLANIAAWLFVLWVIRNGYYRDSVLTRRR